MCLQAGGAQKLHVMVLECKMAGHQNGSWMDAQDYNVLLFEKFVAEIVVIVLVGSCGGWDCTIHGLLFVKQMMVVGALLATIGCKDVKQKMVAD